MLRKHSEYTRKCSIFIQWALGIGITVFIGILVYVICDFAGLVGKYQHAIANENASEGGPKIVLSITFAIILLLAFGYVILSLCNFLSHRSEEDGRVNCLPIMYSPIFLILENGLIHLLDKGINKNGELISFHGNFYPVTMTVISAIVVGVITFASLKFSFEMTSHRDRFIESAKAKPDIRVEKKRKGGCVYNVKVQNNDCYLCGLYVGKIEKVLYRDIKRTGNMFYMRKLFYPNEKVMYKKGGAKEIDFSKFFQEDIKSLCDYARIEEQDIFLIFRDTQHYYYFAQLPNEDNKYNVIGANEYMLTRLLYHYNNRQHKLNKSKRLQSKNQAHTIKYKSMDWFKIPYNFYSSINE